MAESEADTPSTPIEFESKYFEFDGVRLPPFCRGKMEEIANFSLRSSDIWIVTYPKSGKQPVRHRACGENALRGCRRRSPPCKNTFITAAQQKRERLKLCVIKTIKRISKAVNG